MSTPMHSFMHQHGKELITNGYSIIPIGPGAKIPAIYKNNTWKEMPRWNRYCELPTPKKALDSWSAWPECAIGIACGNVVAIDIDVLDPTLADKIEASARECLGDTPAVRIG